MTKQLNALVSTALNAAGAYGTAVEGIKRTLKGQLSPDVVRAALMEPVGAHYNVPVLARARGKGNALCEYTNKARTERRVENDADAVYVKDYEAAKKALQRLVKDVAGKSTPQGAEFDVPAEVQALFDKAWAAAAKYESAGKIAATALATAKAK